MEARTAFETNWFLQSVPAENAETLLAQVRPVYLERGRVLCAVGHRHKHVYFPQNAVVAFVVEHASGDTVEIATVGYDGVVGAPAALGSSVATIKTVVQVAGWVAMINANSMRASADQSPGLRGLLTSHQRFVSTQAQQIAACNARHTIQARLARTLLRYRQLLHGDASPLTQEMMANSLGVRRTSISQEAARLMSAGLISYRRGRIQVLNVSGLEAAACECYHAIEALRASLLREQVHGLGLKRLH